MPLLRLPGHAGDLAAYAAGFTMWMGILALVAAALTAAAAQALWPRGRDAWTAALLFPVGAALTGAIIVNRYTSRWRWCWPRSSFASHGAGTGRPPPSSASASRSRQGCCD